MSKWNLFDPPSSAKELLKDPVAIRSSYLVWRMRVFMSIYIGYAFFYFTRKSFVYLMPTLVQEFGFHKSDLGLFGSVLAISYGVSKFCSGILSDRSNLRYFMPCGLMMTGIANLFFGASSTLIFFCLALGCNGFFQGWGSPPCARLLTSWFPQKERGRFWGMWNTSHNVGGALIPFVVVLITQWLGWRYALYLPGLMAIGVGLLMMFNLRDRPEVVGLPPVTIADADANVGSSSAQAQPARGVFVEQVLKNRAIWALGLAFLFIYVLRTSLGDWIQLYLIEARGYSQVTAGSAVFWFEAGGVFGGVAAGWSSDMLFQGRRGPVNLVFTLGIILSLFCLRFSPGGNSLLFISIVIFWAGFFIFGPQMLIGMAAAELATQEAAGSATGFVGLFAYLGAAAAGYPFGKIIDHSGWGGYFSGLALCSIVVLILLLPFWKSQTSKMMVEGAGS